MKVKRMRALLLPLAGEGAPTQSGRMRAVMPSGTFPHPSPLRADTFSRAREKGRAPSRRLNPALPRDGVADHSIGTPR